MAHFRVNSKVTGNWTRTENMLGRISERSYLGQLPRIEREGVSQLSVGTPKDTGLTSSAWYSEITESDGWVDVDFSNANVVNGFNVVKGLVEGHGTGTGGWVSGNDFVNPIGDSTFTDMADSVWREVINR